MPAAFKWSDLTDYKRLIVDEIVHDEELQRGPVTYVAVFLQFLIIIVTAMVCYDQSLFY